MAKKSSLIDAIKALPARKHGRNFKDSLMPEQLTQYEELLAYLRTIPHAQRPGYNDLATVMKEQIGIAPSIGTLKRDIEGK
jgi:hypothetical protein